MNPEQITEYRAGIYIHIPFCKAKCMYCDFYSLADREGDTDRFIECLIAEIASASEAGQGFRFDTLYLGGGTPSLLTAEHLEVILAALDKHLALDSELEFTLEANPGEAPEEKLRDFRDLGVNRLSIGFQSFHPEILRFLGRLHDPADCTQTLAAARRAGFENINADLIFNIPGQSLDQWSSDLATLADLEPEHISAYSLTIERGTGLHERVTAGDVTMPDENADIAMYALAREYLPSRGYAAYEVSSFARSGKVCRHNIHYWRIEPYLGFGPSAHSFDGTHRSWNVRDLDTYMSHIEKAESAKAGGEDLDPSQIHNEKLAFGLRLREGLSITDDLGYDHANSFIQQYSALLARWKRHLKLTGDRLALTEEGVMLADTIAAEFFQDKRSRLSLSGGNKQRL